MIIKFEGEEYDIKLAKAVYTCANCGNDIYEGEYYWNIENNILCEDCIEYMKEVAELG